MLVSLSSYSFWCNTAIIRHNSNNTRKRIFTVNNNNNRNTTYRGQRGARADTQARCPHSEVARRLL